MTEQGAVLAVNAGSSSVKFALFDPGLRKVLGGVLDGIGSHPRLAVSGRTGTFHEDWIDTGAGDFHALIGRLMEWVEAHLPDSVLAAIGHRVAIGGLEHSGPAIVDGALLEKLRELVPLAPLHQPRNLEPIETLRRSHPHVSQVACFDTAFHRTLPQEAQLYGLPRELTEAGARRYGFHGLSYEYIATALPALDEAAAEGRTIVCHLGSGASLCALRAGRSVATTMGFSPLSGVVMATRPGDLDAGLMIWLMRERGLTIDTVEHMLYHDAGLKGVSGISGDMRELLASTDPRAAEAISLFVYRVVAEIGRLTAALGGLDALVFTAGIGEHSSDIRGAVCKQCAWLGLRLDAGKNSSNVPRISTPDSAITVLIVPTDEERMVAQHAAAMVAGRSRTEEAT